MVLNVLCTNALHDIYQSKILLSKWFLLEFTQVQSLTKCDICENIEQYLEHHFIRVPWTVEISEFFEISQSG